ncbi:hypothetical protein TSAR_000606 [Trichomalopsis sarcophagae]|uniref:Uncharacterized protein n=1 Tax=Trichomalopsis sarcophagae TaxID=543379 RepID=A0A232EJZ4_9HYME|nr:hypothetical protein TSAR_000606 [Trichomalopsis sarcophagae]
MSVSNNLKPSYSYTVHIIFLDACTRFHKHVFAIKKYLKLLSSSKILAGVRPNILIFLSIETIHLINQSGKLQSTVKYVDVQNTNDDHRSSVQYFNDSYMLVDLFKNRKLFNEKLKNMHGYVLRAIYRQKHFGIVPFELYTKSRLQNKTAFRAIADVQYTLMKTIAQTMNFSMNKILKNYTFSNNLFTVCHDLAGKQHGYYYNVNVPWNLTLSISAVLVITILSKVSLRLLRSGSRFASRCNIAMIVFGLSTPVEPKKLSKKIIHSSLLIISVMFSAELLGYIININVIDSGIHITMNNRTYVLLKGSNNLIFSSMNITLYSI